MVDIIIYGTLLSYGREFNRCENFRFVSFTFMRLVNANYAKYFKKKYRCSGHLWQEIHSQGCKIAHFLRNSTLFIKIAFISKQNSDQCRRLAIGKAQFIISGLPICRYLLD